MRLSSYGKGRWRVTILLSPGQSFWWSGGGVKFVVHLCFHPRVLKTGFLTSGAQIGSSC